MKSFLLLECCSKKLVGKLTDTQKEGVSGMMPTFAPTKRSSSSCAKAGALQLLPHREAMKGAATAARGGARHAHHRENAHKETTATRYAF